MVDASIERNRHSGRHRRKGRRPHGRRPVVQERSLALTALEIEAAGYVGVSRGAGPGPGRSGSAFGDDVLVGLVQGLPATGDTVRRRDLVQGVARDDGVVAVSGALRMRSTSRGSRSRRSRRSSSVQAALRVGLVARRLLLGPACSSARSRALSTSSPERSLPERCRRARLVGAGLLGGIIRGRRRGRRGVAARTLAAAGVGAGPRAPALAGERLLGDGDLLLLGGQVGARRVRRAAVGRPGGIGELQAAVVTVAGVDRPVARALALRDGFPGAEGSGDGGRGSGRGLLRRRRHRRSRRAGPTCGPGMADGGGREYGSWCGPQAAPAR